MIFRLTKENCNHCLGTVNVGHPFFQCFRCDVIIHGKCFKNSSSEVIDEKFYCKTCKSNLKKVYNPFQELTENEDEPDPYISRLSAILGNCNSYTVNDFCNKSPKTVDNIGMLFMNIDGNKTNFDSFIVELVGIKNPFSIIGLAETNICPEEKNVYNIPGYNSFYQDIAENKQKGTGTALYIESSYNAVINNTASRTTSNLETIFITIHTEVEPITIGVIYRPPSGNTLEALSELLEILESLPKTPVHIMGDFNINMFEHGHSSLVSKLEEVTLGLGFSPLISLATHAKPGCSETCIDNLYTNTIENTVSSGVIELGISHHYAIFQFINDPTGHKKPTDKKEVHVQLFDYCNSNLDRFSESLYHKFADEPPTQFEDFLTRYNAELEKSCKLDKPKKSKRTTKTNPWITPGIVASVEKKHRLYHNWKKLKKKNKCLIKSKVDHEIQKLCTCEQCQAIATAHEKFKTHRRVLKHIIRYAKSKHFGHKLELCNGDSKKIWRVINELRGKEKRDVKPSFIVDSKRITDRRLIANEFNKYFASLASKLNEKYVGPGIPITPIKSFCEYLPKSCPSTIYMSECTTEEVSIVIKELKNGKSSDIPIHVIKYSAPVILPYLVNLYNRSICEGFFPEVLKTGRITPIYKKDNEELMENYRPVSTLPVFGKILEKLIYSRFYKFFLSKGIIHDSQFGFRKGHSTGHALNYSIHHIENEIRQKKHVVGIFIDLSKAFDTISHQNLLTKLGHYGIRGNALNLIQSYLADRKQYISVLDEESGLLPVVWGVPQGSVLGPLLFLLYINDLCNTTDKCKFILFADDTNIFVAADTKEKAYDLANIVLSSINKYMKSNLLHINTKKSCYMYFSPLKRLKPSEECDVSNNEAIHIDGKILNKVSYIKFLGVLIDDKLNWKPHLDSLNRKLKSTCGRIYRIKSSLPIGLYKDIYHALFESHLSYCISVWGGVSKNRLNPLFLTQKKCVRIIFGNTEAFLDKFRTCARSRPFTCQILGEEFYKREASKPLFNTNKILCIHNLYKYRTIMEVYKILKYHLPISLFIKFNRSTRKDGLLITSVPMDNFVSRSSRLWNTYGQSGGRTDLSVTDCTMKNQIKKQLLEIQSVSEQWCDANFEGFRKT